VKKQTNFVQNSADA